MVRARRIEAAAALVDILEREGVTAIFGVPGGLMVWLCRKRKRYFEKRDDGLGL